MMGSMGAAAAGGCPRKDGNLWTSTCSAIAQRISPCARMSSPRAVLSLGGYGLSAVPLPAMTQRGQRPAEPILRGTVPMGGHPHPVDIHLRLSNCSSLLSTANSYNVDSPNQLCSIFFSTFGRSLSPARSTLLNLPLWVALHRLRLLGR